MTLKCPLLKGLQAANYTPNSSPNQFWECNGMVPTRGGQFWEWFFIWPRQYNYHQKPWKMKTWQTYSPDNFSSLALFVYLICEIKVKKRQEKPLHSMVKEKRILIKRRYLRSALSPTQRGIFFVLHCFKLT